MTDVAGTLNQFKDLKKNVSIIQRKLKIKK